MQAPEQCFYMNFKLLNVAEAFPKIVRAKVRVAGKSDTAVKLAGKGSALMASKPKFALNFANQIADKLTELMPHALEENGICLMMSKVHCGETGFIVLRAEVVNVDIVKLLEAAKGTEFAGKLAPLVGMVRWFTDIDRKLVPTVQEVVMSKMDQEIPAMMYEKARFKLLMISKTSAEQSEFFFNALSPHCLEIAIETADPQAAALRLADEGAKGKFGTELGRGKLLGQLVGSVGSRIATKAPEETFGKLAPTLFSEHVCTYLADVGVTLSVMQVLKESRDATGSSIVLRSEIRDVDLEAFRSSPGAHNESLAGILAQGQHMLKLGPEGRSKVYVAIREYIQNELAKSVLAQKGLHVTVAVRDPAKNAAPEMMEITGLSDSEEEDEEAKTSKMN